MHSILISSPYGKKAWSLHRSTEIIGYHRHEKRVSIVVALLVMNKLRRAENFLRFTHRGNVQCQLIPSWPLPRHPDEKPQLRPSVLEMLYSPGFSEEADGVYRKLHRTPWDSWHAGADEVKIRVWPPGSAVDSTDSAESSSNRLRLLTPEADSDIFVPISTWELGPFSRNGFHLIAFSLAFQGETYERLVGECSSFSVDGPRRLISQILQDKQAISDRSAPDPSAIRINDFLDPSLRLTATSYDIVILGPPWTSADKVEVCQDQCATGIYPAPQPLVCDGIQRFLARDQCFTLPFAYADCPGAGKTNSPLQFCA